MMGIGHLADLLKLADRALTALERIADSLEHAHVLQPCEHRHTPAPIKVDPVKYDKPFSHKKNTW